MVNSLDDLIEYYFADTFGNLLFRMTFGLPLFLCCFAADVLSGESRTWDI